MTYRIKQCLMFSIYNRIKQLFDDVFCTKFYVVRKIRDARVANFWPHSSLPDFMNGLEKFFPSSNFKWGAF